MKRRNQNVEHRTKMPKLIEQRHKLLFKYTMNTYAFNTVFDAPECRRATLVCTKGLKTLCQNLVSKITKIQGAYAK